MQPETYSYVQTITAAGYAVLNLDRIGIGQSDHPPALDVTITSNAWVVHQLIGDLRQGSIGDVAFSKVILVGHSLGSQVSLLEASTYADVDGVILTGLLHVFFPTGLATVTSSFYPVQLDPNFATSGLPEGYITTRPGTRGADFYHTADADSAVIALDETLKQTGTDGESTDSADTLLPSVSQKIHVPVLLAVGQYDSLFCNGLTLACNNQSDILARESTDYAPQACLEAYVLSQSGHDLNLHLNANEWFAAAVDWANRRIGESATNPATQPCE
jgi:pimeloyl-ACP methyl ester carboxylesterase